MSGYRFISKAFIKVIKFYYKVSIIINPSFSGNDLPVIIGLVSARCSFTFE